MDIWKFDDDLGPVKTLFVRDSGSGLRGMVVVDNTARGPAIGGIRMAADVDWVEVFRLARAMTFKNAAAGLVHGGGKAAIVHDPRCDPEKKQALARAFARKIRELVEYIPGPDMGTDERCMAWIHDEIGRAVGLPRALGGIPLDEIGATGFGLAVAAEVAAPAAGFPLEGARVAVQGFGAVGRHAARFLVARGARLVAASDSRGTVESSRSLDVEALIAHKQTAEVATFRDGTARERDAIFAVDCDIFIPAARPDVLDEHNVGLVRAKVVLQGANIPVTAIAERILHERGVVNIVDFIANAGGVICAAAEYHGQTQARAFATIEERIRENTSELLERVRRDRLPAREAALTMAKSRVLDAMQYRC